MAREVKNVLVAAGFVDNNNMFAASSGFVDTGQDLEVASNILALQVSPDVDLDPNRTMIMFTPLADGSGLSATFLGDTITVLRQQAGDASQAPSFYIAIYTAQTEA